MLCNVERRLVEMNESYVKLYRRLLDNPVLAMDNNAFILFTKLLLKVNYKDGSVTLGRSQLATLCNLKQSTTYITAKRLQSNNMITAESCSKYTKFTVVNWAKYQSPSETGQQQDNSNITSKRAKHNTIKRKRIYIDTNVSMAIEKSPSSEINEMFEYWTETTGNEISSQLKSNRYACSNLLKKHGKDKLKLLINGVSIARQDAYAPRISNFSQLQTKQDDLIVWGQKNKLSSQKKVVVI